MNRKQIEKWARESHAFETPSGGLCLYLGGLETFARLVRNAAINDAVNECFAVDNTGDYVCHNRDDCAKAINALKELQP